MPAVRCPDCGRDHTPPPGAAPAACPHCGSAAVGRSTVGHRRGGLQSTFGSGPPPSTASLAAGPPVDLAPGLLIGGRYELADELGRGAFGVVYRALDTRRNRTPVAIKVLLDTALATPDAVKRFRAEGDVLCDVQHPHVPAVMDIGEVGTRQYIALQFVKGKTVKELIPPGGMADPVAAARLGQKLARTLHDIYTGWTILHRDVKPANMMVPDSQPDGLYLMDFGLAVCNRADVTRTQDGTVLGTPAYMAPEQAKGLISATDHRADLYSAAAVLYHLLTGRPPFVGDTIYALMIAIAGDPAEPPSAHRGGLDPELDAIVLKGLAKRPEDRYQTGAEFAARLELWAAKALVERSKVPRPIPTGPSGAGGAKGAGGSVGPGATSGQGSVARKPAPGGAAERSRSSLVVKPLAMPLPEPEPEKPKPPRAVPVQAAPPPAPRDVSPFMVKMSAVVASVLMVAAAAGLLYYVVVVRIMNKDAPKPTVKEIPR